MADKLVTKGDASPIINDSIINFDINVKHKSVMERKQTIYIPLIEELNNYFKFPNGDLFSKLEFKFLNEIINKQYLYRLENEMLNECKNFYDLINKFNKTDLTYVASNIIESSFYEGFNELYGNIIDGKIAIYDNEGEVVAWEDVEPEEFENIRHISYHTDRIIELINHQYDYQYSFDDYGNDYDGALYINQYLSYFYEFALAKRNKKNSPSRTQIIDWEGKPEDYISYNYDFFSNFYADGRVKEKEKLLTEIKTCRSNLLNKLDSKLKYIFVTYEKE
jgi:hypothetical protein